MRLSANMLDYFLNLMNLISSPFFYYKLNDLEFQISRIKRPIL